MVPLCGKVLEYGGGGSATVEKGGNNERRQVAEFHSECVGIFQ